MWKFENGKNKKTAPEFKRNEAFIFNMLFTSLNNFNCKSVSWNTYFMLISKWYVANRDGVFKLKFFGFDSEEELQFASYIIFIHWTLDSTKFHVRADESGFMFNVPFSSKLFPISVEFINANYKNHIQLKPFNWNDTIIWRKFLEISIQCGSLAMCLFNLLKFINQYSTKFTSIEFTFCKCCIRFCLAGIGFCFAAKQLNWLVFTYIIWTIY